MTPQALPITSPSTMLLLHFHAAEALHMLDRPVWQDMTVSLQQQLGILIYLIDFVDC
jgi:hypothetical protein